MPVVGFRILRLLAPLTVVFAVACGPARGALPPASDAGCSQNSECVLPYCPTQCMGGQSPCGYPRAYGKAEALAACPCLEPKAGMDCTSPGISECGPLPACAALDGMVHAECRASRCVAVLEDGGVP